MSDSTLKEYHIFRLLNHVSVTTPSLISFAPGAIGGFCNVCVGHPMDLIKVRQQAAVASVQSNTNFTSTTTVLTLTPHRSSSAPSSSTINMLRTIFLTDGAKGLYAGISAPLVAVVPSFAVTFASYEVAKNHIVSHGNNNNQQPLTVLQATYAGAISGIPSSYIIGPTERIKCLMQTNNAQYNYKTFRSAVRHVYQQGGIRSLMRGTFLTICRDVPGNAAYFSTYEYLKRSLLHNFNSDYDNDASSDRTRITATIVAGGFAGVANWIVAIPIDVIKSRWQTAHPNQYTNVSAVVKHLLRTEGPTAFFSGLTPALLRAFPANAACFLGAESVTQIAFQR